MVTNVKPLLGNAVTQPVQIDFWLRFGRLGNEANCCFFLLSPASCGFLRADGASLKSADLYTTALTHELVCLLVADGSDGFESQWPLTSWSEVRFYENLVNTWRRWCSNTIGVSKRRLRDTACSRQYFSTRDSLSLRHPHAPAVCEWLL